MSAMDKVPPIPEDPEMKNIIDKLANFVARNGMQFEKMTKDKQQQNPKFAFLFGGEHYNYYQYKLNSERQMFNQQQAKDNMIQHSLQNAPWQQAPNSQPQAQVPPMPLMNRFAPPPQPPMGGRMPMPNMPPWQNQGIVRPPMNMQRFMSPTSGPNRHPAMGQPPPGQMFRGPPPTNNNQSNVTSNQQPIGPGNFNMFRQPPPNMPPQGQFPTGPGQQNQFPFSEPNSVQFNQGASNVSSHPDSSFTSMEFNDKDKDVKTKSIEEEEDEEIAKEEAEARKKIDESSSNLKQQYEVLMSQQQEKIEIAIANAQDTKLRELASDTGVMTSDFDTILQPIIITCTKDSISAGKLWILNRVKTKEHCEVIGLHLLKRVIEADKSSVEETGDVKTKFEKQLHLVYLINDVLHHASRKNMEDLSTALQHVILPIFCMASANASKDEKDRLSKLLGLWQKFKYFKEELLAKLKYPENALSEYQADLIIEHSKEVQKVQKDIQDQYIQYEKQHNEYTDHILKLVNEKKDEIMKKRQERAKRQEKETSKGEQEVPPWAGNFDDINHGGYGHDMSKPQVIDYSHSRDPSEWQEPEWRDDFGPPMPWNQGPRGPRMERPWQETPWHDPHGSRGPRPRGPRPLMEQIDTTLIPKVPYYDLPAGLMCPLVKLEDCDYIALDPKMIRLPAPIPPSDRLLAAVEAFYGPPSHERPRDVDGWERNGLFEFYRAKVRARRQKEGQKSRSRSPSRSRSKSRSKSRSHSRSRSRSRSRGRSYSRSYSRSKSKSQSRSPSSRSRSHSPRRRSRTPDRGRRSRSRGRSPTPPSFGGRNMLMPQDNDGRLGDENRGAQMLKRMGWGGAGLGAKEQGREDPIDHAEVRDKYDQFKGLGMPTGDPYESFRKSKSQGFITRMKARDKERGKDRKTGGGPPRRSRNVEDR